ncbi:MAG: TraB/GumN family protein [Sulfuricaulis sp.]
MRFCLKSLVIICLALPLWFGVAGASSAAPGDVASKLLVSDTGSDSAARHTKGLLWKIEAAGIQPSYIFGTIHSDDARVAALPAAVTHALDTSSHFVMEALIDADDLALMAQDMFFNDGQTLEQIAGNKLYTESVQALSARGLPTVGIENEKPWAVMMTLSMPLPKTGEYLDLILEDRATREHETVSGLETMPEQIAVFNELPMPDQVALLQETVRTQPDFSKDFEALIQTYLSHDLTALAEISASHGQGDDQMYRIVTDRLLTQRNIRMVARLAPTLREGRAFIAVGAAHLPGENGLLNLIEKAGYRVTPVF